jgi:hypothetical protein
MAQGGGRQGRRVWTVLLVGAVYFSSLDVFWDARVVAPLPTGSGSNNRASQANAVDVLELPERFMHLLRV